MLFQLSSTATTLLLLPLPIIPILLVNQSLYHIKHILLHPRSAGFSLYQNLEEADVLRVQLHQDMEESSLEFLNRVMREESWLGAWGSCTDLSGFAERSRRTLFRSNGISLVW